MKRTIDLKNFDPEMYVSIEDASKFLGFKEQTLRNYMYLDRLTRYKYYNLTLVSKKELAELKKEF